MNVLVDLDKIKYNIKTIKNHTNKDIIAVVKSNAYGLGARNIIKALLKEKVNYFFFNKLSEYLEVQDLLTNYNVIIFESLSLANINKWYTSNLILTINNYQDAIVYNKSNKLIRAHIQVDTGMNRMGIRNIETFMKVINYCNSNVLIEGIYTHYASDSNEYKYFQYQQEEFQKYLKHYDFKLVHSNATSSLHKNIIGNMVRVGMGMYGYHSKLPLKECLFVRTKLINLFRCNDDMQIGYNGQYLASKDDLIGVVDIGYFNSNIINKVYINNKKYYFIGKTCMNHAFIKVDNKINYLSRLRILPVFDIINIDEYDYYKLLTSMNHLKKNYIERI